MAGMGGSALQSFKARVQANGGTFEGETCLSNFIASAGLTRFSWLLTPNGFKYQKLYSIVPSNGNGDLTFARTSPALRRLSSSYERVGLSIPRLDYLNASCPSIVVEPQTSNLLLNSEYPVEPNWTKSATTVLANNSPELAGPDNLFVFGNYAILTIYSGNAVQIMDISNPSSPVVVSTVRDGDGGASLNGPLGIFADATYLYITSARGNKLEIIDWSTPASPVHVGNVALGGSGWNLDVSGNYAAVVISNALLIVDITTKSAPAIIGTLTNGTGGASLSTPLACKFSADTNSVFVASYGSSAFEVVNTTTKSAPSHSASITSSMSGAHGLAISGNYAYVACRTGSYLKVVDITAPSSPAVVGTLTDGSGGALLTGVTDVTINGNDLFATCFDGSGFEVVDITTPSSPTHKAKLLDGINGNYLDRADMPFYKNGYVYCTCRFGNALTVINVADSSNPVQVSATYKMPDETKVLETVANAAHFLRNNFTQSASAQRYIISAIFKKLGRDYVCMQYDNGTAIAGKFFNINNGTLGNDRTASGGVINNSAIKDLGSGYYLCMIDITTIASATFNFTILASTDGSTISYVGDVTKGFYILASQVCKMSGPLWNSYYRTWDASAETKSADVISSLATVSSLIGQTEGTLFLDCLTPADGVQKNVSISDGTTDNRITIQFHTDNKIYAKLTQGSVEQASIANAAFANLTRYKIAVTYQNNKVALFVNGSKVGEDLSATVPACSSITFNDGSGSNLFYGNIYAHGIMKTALSDADAQTLTT